MIRFEKAAVLGAGTMGAQIAAHLANAGIPTLLLDIAPKELTPEERARGLTLDAREVRDRVARGGLEAAKKAKPAAFFTPDAASLITVGNFDDDLARIKDCDIVIEAVVENLEIKRRLFDSDFRAGSILDWVVGAERLRRGARGGRRADHERRQPHRGHRRGQQGLR